MSAFADTDDRDRALKLINLRALEIPTIKGPAERVIAEAATESEQKIAGLLHAVLEIFATIRPLLRPPGSLAARLVDVELLETAKYDQNTDHRLAAKLIVAHEAFGADGSGENVFRDHGADEFDRRIDQMDVDRYHETIIAVVDVWLRMLSELRNCEGMRELEEHAKGLDSD